ncbi:MAG: S-layer homology domain-containing protein, partial [Clostridiales bacterium]|nr:S-layer homology domain-containing protein [Clostridiales bacterium]
TAPVWVGSAPKVGINSFNSSAAMPVTGEPLTLAVQVFNSEIASATVKSIEYSINGTVLKTDTPDTAVTAEEMKLFKFDYTPTTPGLTTAEVKVTILLGGEETDFSAKLDLDVRDSAKLVYVGIDSSHYNEYVDGNYKASMGNFAILAAEYDVRVVELKTSEDLIEATQNPRYKMMVLTPPTRRNGTVILDGYKNYSDAELEAITKFSEAGNVVILSGWGDYYESYATFPAGDHMAAQQNKVLESLGSTLRISDDELKDDVSNGGQAQRLYLTEYNMDNQFLEGVLPAEQVYSNYAGATIYAADASGPVAELPGSVSAMVYSFETSYSADDDKDEFAGVIIPKYDKKYLVAASETIPRGDGIESIVIASGAVFMSNFEIQASELDNYQTPAYSNYTILANVLKFLSPTVITPIADVHKGNPGERFTIRGIATSNASGFDQDTAFFDCIYLQDDTAGINAFPVSASIQKGQTVELTGTVSAYNGEIQLNVTKITIIDEAVKDLPEPITVTTAEAKSGANLGSLVKVTGTVKSFTAPNDVVASIYVDDGSGEECLIFIDGYITESKVIANLVPGASITAIGLSSISTEGPRIRVRDRADITCTVTNISSVPALEPIKTVANGTAKEAVALGLPETVEIVTTGGTATAKVVWDLASSTYDPDSKLAQEFTVAGLIELPEGVLNQDGVSLAVSITVEVLAASEEEPGEPGEEEPGEPGEPGEEEPGEPGEEEPTPTPAAPPSGGGGWDYYVPSWPQPTPSKAPTPVPTKAPSVVTDGGTSVPKVFVDAKPADWFYQDVEYIASRGLMVGTSATEFSPNNTLSRGMIVTILGRLYEVDTARFTQTSFKDVNLGIYYAPYVEWAKANGIAVGVADGVFQPEGFITRQDLAAIIYRYILAAGLKLPEKNAYIKFTDDANISDYARTAIEAACKYGIIYGRTDGTFDPRGTATRAEAAAIVHRLIVAAGLE